MFDVMRDLTRVGVDPVQAVVPPNILVNIPQPAPLNDVLYKLGYDTIDFAFMRMREDLWTAADVVAEVVFGLDFVRATHKWFGLGTALELYALWSVGYIDDPAETAYGITVPQWRYAELSLVSSHCSSFGNSIYLLIHFTSAVTTLQGNVTFKVNE